ncbi:gluconokinase [Zobellia galactanivorans]|uniref:Gluconokinase n=1 Tax=Zobellia galactanivorans (strain DSM 12802 / CCUG 47099 / CIP 106680 / NCIMB 13871 / Dsij) TaxID=63186 RepID=G0L4T5_ZOBGA|nr:gluconokinase [Zobellia galactanivorans]CAZ98892.1 Gluconokinase [Zobellia galactanivorans]
MNDRNPIIFVMGVSGSGKSTIGLLLAEKLHINFFDGDDFHPKENVKKMAEGIPLDDDDRQGWLERLNLLALENSEKGAIIACSALKTKYRSILQKGLEKKLHFVYLKGSFDEIMARLRQRQNHFMPPALLQSQFDTLEVPDDAITVSIMLTPDEITDQVIAQLKNKKAPL